MSIRENSERVEERIRAACARAERRREEVRLIAVSKTFPVTSIRAAYEAGLRDFGENRVQEAALKIPELGDLAVTWHLIGHLQTNKARRARELFGWIQTVDSPSLAEKLERAARPGANRLPILLEVNLGGEESKYGLSEREVMETAEKIVSLPSLDLRGLMLIPPFFADPEGARPFFRRLCALAAELRAAGFSGVSELSMGMSHDFEAAIEEGATMIRVGTAIFSAREIG